LETARVQFDISKMYTDKYFENFPYHKLEICKFKTQKNIPEFDTIIMFYPPSDRLCTTTTSDSNLQKVQSEK